MILHSFLFALYKSMRLWFSGLVTSISANFFLVGQLPSKWDPMHPQHPRTQHLPRSCWLNSKTLHLSISIRNLTHAVISRVEVLSWYPGFLECLSLLWLPEGIWSISTILGHSTILYLSQLQLLKQFLSSINYDWLFTVMSSRLSCNQVLVDSCLSQNICYYPGSSLSELDP
jgi:hypothetical protein